MPHQVLFFILPKLFKRSKAVGKTLAAFAFTNRLYCYRVSLSIQNVVVSKPFSFTHPVATTRSSDITLHEADAYGHGRQFGIENVGNAQLRPTKCKFEEVGGRCRLSESNFRNSMKLKDSFLYLGSQNKKRHQRQSLLQKRSAG